MLNMFNIEWLEALWSVLALISAALSVYLWKRAAAVPSLLDQSALTLAWRARLHAQAGSAAAFAVFFLILLMISQVIEAMSGTVPPTIAWPPQSKTATPVYSITSSIEEDPCAAEIRTLWEAKRTSGEAVDRVDPTPLTQSGQSVGLLRPSKVMNALLIPFRR